MADGPHVFSDKKIQLLILPKTRTPPTPPAPSKIGGALLLTFDYNQRLWQCGDYNFKYLL